METKKLCVIGDPIAHSLSPDIHNFLSETLGLPYVYEKRFVARGTVGDFVRQVKEEKILGFNATMPHKVDLLQYVPCCDAASKACGSINTVKVTDQGMEGYNTDGIGFQNSLLCQGINLKGKKVLILGSGGAAMSIANTCVNEGCDLTILNRSQEKSQDLVEHLHCGQAGAMTQEQLHQWAPWADIIVNCTPLGMEGCSGDFEDLSFVNESHAVLFDTIYRPWRTSFLKAGEAKGLPVINGLDMLIYQGIRAYEIFTGERLDVFPLGRQLHEKLEEKI